MEARGIAEADIHHLPHDAAGRRVVTNVPVVADAASVGDIEQLLLKQVDAFETINYIYVVDAEDMLLGVLSIKELFGQPKQTPVRGVMLQDPITVRAHTDQERVALLALRHNIKALPVVDKKGRFLGVIPSDAVLNILHSESVEDALKAAGIRHEGDAEGLLRGGTRLNVRRRLPWLVVGLLGGLFAAGVVGAFEHALAVNLALAAFIPTVVYMADAVGTQSQTILIRALAVEREPTPLWEYLRRELRISAVLALLLGIGAFALVVPFTETPDTAVILAASLAATVVAASIVAVLLPFLFLRFRADPAVASGPLATIIRDLMSLLIYFGIASLLL